MLPATLGIDEACAPKNLQMSRRVGEAQVRPRRKFFDAALALRDVLQQLQPMRVTKRLGHLREAGEDCLLWPVA